MPLEKNKSNKSLGSGEGVPGGRLQTTTTPTTSVTAMQCTSAIQSSVTSPCVSCQQLAQQTSETQQQCHHHHHHHHYNPQKHRRLPPSGKLNSHIMGSNFEQDNSTTCSSSGGENISLQQQQGVQMTATNNFMQSVTNTTTSSLPPSLKIRLYELFGQIEREFEVLYSENLNLQERVDQLIASGHNNNVIPGSASTSTISTLTNNLHLLGDANLGNQQLQNTEFANKQSQMYSYPTMPTTYETNENATVKQQQQQQSVHKFQQSQQPHHCQPSSQQQNTHQLQQPLHQKSSRVHKLRSHTNRLRQQTTRIMSNFASKGPSGNSTVNCTPLRR